MTDAEQAAVEWLQRSAQSKSPSMAKEHATVLLAERDRLRAALERIAEVGDSQWGGIADIAREALEGK